MRQFVRDLIGSYHWWRSYWTIRRSRRELVHWAEGGAVSVPTVWTTSASNVGVTYTVASHNDWRKT